MHDVHDKCHNLQGGGGSDCSSTERGEMVELVLANIKKNKMERRQNISGIYHGKE